MGHQAGDLGCKFLNLPLDCDLPLFQVLTLLLQVICYNRRPHDLYLYAYLCLFYEVHAGSEVDRISWVQVINSPFVYRALYLFHARHYATQHQCRQWAF